MKVFFRNLVLRNGSYYEDSREATESRVNCEFASFLLQHRIESAAKQKQNKNVYCKNILCMENKKRSWQSKQGSKEEDWLNFKDIPLNSQQLLTCVLVVLDMARLDWLWWWFILIRLHNVIFIYYIYFLYYTTISFSTQQKIFKGNKNFFIHIYILYSQKKVVYTCRNVDGYNIFLQ